jgi:hypothetical protein
VERHGYNIPVCDGFGLAISLASLHGQKMARGTELQLPHICLAPDLSMVERRPFAGRAVPGAERIVISLTL